MFLDMYNFGFAVSQGTPQLTPDAIKLITLTLSVHAMGRKFDYPAQIVGFSDRISSVLVPQTFMDWANENFGAANTEASRVIIRTDDSGDHLDRWHDDRCPGRRLVSRLFRRRKVSAPSIGPQRGGQVDSLEP